MTSAGLFEPLVPDHVGAALKREFARTQPVRPSSRAEKLLSDAGFRRVAGIDEAGRGCLAGPVVAAAVILPRGARLRGLNDSKKLSASVRFDLAPRIRRVATGWATAVCSPAEIDRWNILNASLEAMRRAVDGLAEDPDFVLIDGNRAWPQTGVPCATVIKGDARCRSIAAASVLAKTVRDGLMTRLAGEYPGYGWERNFGYPTPEHLDALQRLGPTPYHRQSFAPVRARAAQAQFRLDVGNTPIETGSVA